MRFGCLLCGEGRTGGDPGAARRVDALTRGIGKPAGSGRADLGTREQGVLGGAKAEGRDEADADDREGDHWVVAFFD